MKYEPGGRAPPAPHVVKLQDRIRALKAALRSANADLREVWIKTGEGLEGLKRTEVALGLTKETSAQRPGVTNEAALDEIHDARLEWAMVCPCICTACDKFYETIRDGLASQTETACEWFCYGSGHVDAVKNTGETCRVCGNERCPTEKAETDCDHVCVHGVHVREKCAQCETLSESATFSKEAWDNLIPQQRRCDCQTYCIEAKLPVDRYCRKDREGK